MKIFLKVWSILLLVVGCFETLPLLAGGNDVQVGTSVAVGIPIIIESICVLIFLDRKNKENNL